MGAAVGRPRGEGRDWGNLHRDVIEGMSLYLPQKDRVEAMLVCSSWEKAIRHGKPWQTVDVLRNWVTMGEGGLVANSSFLSGLLRGAEEVTFSNGPYKNFVLVPPLEKVLGDQLKSLVMPGAHVASSFFSELLANCAHLELLEVSGEPLGEDHVQLIHPTLKSLKLEGLKSRPLTVTCPGLLRLVMNRVDNINGAHNIHCPILTTLALDPLPYAPETLDSIASHAPLIDWLEIRFSSRFPSHPLTHFKSLKFLRLINFSENLALHFSLWSGLEDLQLYGNNFTRAMVLQHQGLRSVTISDLAMLGSAISRCPALEHLTLAAYRLDPQCLSNLNTSCPNLRQLIVVRVIRGDLPGGPVELRHELLEELEVRGELCSKVKPEWDGRVFIISAVDCPKVVKLQIGNFFGFSCLPLMLSGMPSLSYLKISGVHMIFGSMLLDHPKIQKVVMEKSSMIRLTLHLTSLEHASFVESDIRVLNVTHRKEVVMDYKYGGVSKLFVGGKMWVPYVRRSQRCSLKVV